MRRHKLLQAFCLAVPAAAVLVTPATLVEAASEECRAKPDLSAQMGEGHWHYRIDRTNQRRCWFLSSGNSRMRHASSLRRRKSINRSTASEIEGLSKLDGRMSAGPTPVQEPFVLSEKPIPRELAVPEVGGEPPESLIPHKVTLISFVRPRVGEQSLGRGTNFDLVFFCGVLATALLFAGGVLISIDRFRRFTRTTSPTPVPLFKAKRSQSNAASSKGTNLKEVREYFGHSNITSPRPRATLLRYPQLH